MEEKQWKRLMGQSFGVLLLLLVLCMGFSGGFVREDAYKVKAEAYREEAPVVPNVTPEAEKASLAENQEIVLQSGNYIRILKEAVKASDIYLTNQYMERSIQLRLENVKQSQVSAGQIQRKLGNQIREGKVQKKDSGDLFRKLEIREKKKKNSSVKDVVLEIQLKELYEPALFETETAYYVTLAHPRDLYDKIVVIDAGHGGNDEGTVAENGKQREKDYTLLVVEQLKDLFDKSGRVKVYYTRLEDRFVSKKDRTNLANDLQADAFISVHCNASDPGDTTANGVESLYSKRKTGTKLSNKKLANILLQNVTNITGNRKRGVIQREKLYLLHHANVPTTIIEIGYMSNKSDMKYLSQKKGRKKIADGIYQGILSAIQ